MTVPAIGTIVAVNGSNIQGEIVEYRAEGFYNALQPSAVPSFTENGILVFAMVRTAFAENLMLIDSARITAMVV